MENTKIFPQLNITVKTKQMQHMAKFFMLKNERMHNKTAWLAPAYFSPNYKYFDQLLPPVKKKTTFPNLVSKEFLQTSIPPLISVLYAKENHYFPSSIFCLTVPKKFVSQLFSVLLIPGIEKCSG